MADVIFESVRFLFGQKTEEIATEAQKCMVLSIGMT